jgi:hypothetical protein
LSKIHAGNRLSGPLGSGNRSIAAALELVALHFCANSPKLSKFAGQVKQNLQDFLNSRFPDNSRLASPSVPGIPGPKDHHAAPNFERSLFGATSINDAHR